MRKLLLYLLLLYGPLLYGQYNVRFVVQPPEVLEDKIYLAGTFNDWRPNDENFQLLPLDAQHLYFDLNVPAGRYEYKFTRGNWSTVEIAGSGTDIANRVIEVHIDTTVKIIIGGWLDRFKDISGLPDSTQWQVAYSRSFFYLEKNLDSSYKYAQQANALTPRLKNKKYDAAMQRILGRIMQRQGNHQRALEYYLKQLSFVQDLKDTLSIAFCLLDIGELFLGIKDYANAKKYYLQVVQFDPEKANAFGRGAPNLALVGIAKVFYNLHQIDSARFYALQAYESSLKTTDRPAQSESLTVLGNILSYEERPGEAIKYYLLAIRQAELYNSTSTIAENYLNIARAYYSAHQVDSGFYYARKAFGLANELKNPLTIVDASNLLVTLFKNTRQMDSAFKYLETVVAAKDSLYNQSKNQQLQTILFNEELQKQESEAKNEKFRTRVKIFIMAGGIILLFFLCIFLWVRNKGTRTT